MAIRFTPSYNAEIRRVVNNFNQKRNRAVKRGVKNLPPALTVSELKSRYDNRRDLDRDLSLIQKFNNDDALNKVETSGGATAIKWEVNYLKANLKRAKEFYDRELYEARHESTKMKVSKAEYINNLKEKRSILDMELTQLNQSDYRTYRATIDEFLQANTRNLGSYRGWLREVETIMRYMGYDDKTINKFFEGMDKLTPRQFVKLYRNNALISRIYELYIPTNDGSFRLSTTDENAKELIDTFIEEKDEMINNLKQEEALMDDSALKAFSKSLDKFNDAYFAKKEKEDNMPVSEWMKQQRAKYKNDPKKLKEFEDFMKL